MKISIDAAQPDYPVGSNIRLAKRLVNAYLQAFNQLGYDEEEKVNLWCRGSSGAILATIFAVQCPHECKVVHVKKPGEDSHSFGPKYFEGGINVIIDDFVASGETIMSIMEEIVKTSDRHGVSIPFDVLMVMCINLFNETKKAQFKHLIGDL